MSVSRSFKLAATPLATSDPTGFPSVRERVLEIILAQFRDGGFTSIDPDATFDELGADPLDLIEIVQAFEDEFCVSLDDEILDEMTTVSACIAALERRLGVA